MTLVDDAIPLVEDKVILPRFQSTRKLAPLRYAIPFFHVLRITTDDYVPRLRISSFRRWAGESNFLTFVPWPEFQLDQLYGFRQALEITVARNEISTVEVVTT